MVSTRNQGNEVPGKAVKARRHQSARTPYSRQAPGAPAASMSTPTHISYDGLEHGNRPSILRSVGGSVFSAATTPLRAAANLVQKVPLFASYFSHADETEKEVEEVIQSSIEQEILIDEANDRRSNQQDRQVKGDNAIHPVDLVSDEAPSLENNTKEDISAPPQAVAVRRNADFNFEVNGRGPFEGTKPHVTTRRGGEETPYDDVLTFLRRGPLASGRAMVFPRPSRLAVGDSEHVETPKRVDMDGFETTKPNGEVRAARKIATGVHSSILESIQRDGFAGSGLKAGAAHRPGSVQAMKGDQSVDAARVKSFGRREEPRISSFRDTATSSGRAGASDVRMHNFAPIATITRMAGEGGHLPTPSPPKLAWTPMRSTPSSKLRPSVGSKRKAKDEEALGTPGSLSVSTLDAQRRSRVRSTPAADGRTSTGRRSWRAGRTPFQPLSSRSRLRFSSAAAGFQEAGQVTPVLPSAGMQEFVVTPAAGTGALAPTEANRGSKRPSTTDTAEKVLRALHDIDSTLKPKSDEKKVYGIDGDSTPTSAPPRESLGGLLPKRDEASTSEEKLARPKRPRVTFAELAAPLPPEPMSIGASLFKGKEEEKQREDSRDEDKKKTPETSRAAQEKLAFPGIPMETGPAIQKKDVATSSATTSARGSEKASLLVFEFGAQNRNKDLNERIKDVVASAQPCTEPAPRYMFGERARSEVEERKQQQQETPGVPGAPSFGIMGAFPPKPPLVVLPKSPPPALVEKANKDAEEAAKSPLPPLGAEEEERRKEEGGDAVKANEIREKEVEGEEKTAAAVHREADAVEKQIEESKKEESETQATGWDMSFLAKNKTAMAAATASVQKEIEGASKSSGPAVPGVTTTEAPPTFSFGRVSAPAASFSFGASSAAASLPAVGAKTSQAFTFGTASVKMTESAMTPPAKREEKPTGITGSDATAVSEKPFKAKEAPSAQQNSSGWGADFLAANREAAEKAASAAAEESKKKTGGGEMTKAAPAFLFGMQNSDKTAASPASIGTFASTPALFGTSTGPAVSGVETTTSAAASLFSFGASSSVAATGSAPTFTFGASAAAPSSTFTGAPDKAAQPDATLTPAASPAPTFGFGNSAGPPSSTQAKPETGSKGLQTHVGDARAPFMSQSTAGFESGTASSSLFATGDTKPPSSLSFGRVAPATQEDARKPPSFTFGAGDGSSAPASGTFTFGAKTDAAAAPSTSFALANPPPAGSFQTGTSSQLSASAPSFDFGANASLPSFGMSSQAPSFVASAGASSGPFPSSMTTSGQQMGVGTPTPAAGFSFGSTVTASSQPPSGFASGFGFGAAQSSTGAPPAFSAPGFGSASSGFGASAPAIAGFGAGFGSGPTSAPSSGFGTGFGAGGMAAPSQSFTFGASENQPGSFGGGQMAAPQAQQSQMPPAFAAPAFGSTSFGAPSGGFGAQAPFGTAPQAPEPGQMIPNNPFGSGVGSGGFSVGTSGGNSQSEGRRKLRVKRAHRR